MDDGRRRSDYARLGDRTAPETDRRGAICLRNAISGPLTFVGADREREGQRHRRARLLRACARAHTQAVVGSRSTIVVRWTMSGPQRCVMLMFLTVGAGGVFEAALPVGLLATGVPCSALMALWCKLDARERRVSLPTWNFALVLWLVLAGLPVYFLRTLPFVRATTRLFTAIGMFIGLQVFGSA